LDPFSMDALKRSTIKPIFLGQSAHTLATILTDRFPSSIQILRNEFWREKADTKVKVKR